MNRYYLTLIVYILIYYKSVFAQEKYEKEERIHANSVHTSATEFINEICIGCKVKWYLEEGLTSKSIEAKFTNDKSKYSIEFDTLGNIEDTEVEISIIDLDHPLRDSINNYLSKSYNKYKIQKIQIQYSGHISHIINKLNNDVHSDNLLIKYELIVKCSEKKEKALYEFQFSNSGRMESMSKIIFKSSSHLEY
ncbi:hypothetical protein [Algoriphagus sp. CAU 1675]|uniref:hypothetical protein n=1 Tax=Algoriphagus sp. CAU 1675 TaxID=3032597 RepID=UPI0023DB8F6F|nr:hypothetical protein [Algoriphagus sp. CAU 1675]MDF2159108.1 hypothetical protein [Algoriphagus sp. CAU 1675]